MTLSSWNTVPLLQTAGVDAEATGFARSLSQSMGRKITVRIILEQNSHAPLPLQCAEHEETFLSLSQDYCPSQWQIASKISPYQTENFQLTIALYMENLLAYVHPHFSWNVKMDNFW